MKLVEFGSLFRFIRNGMNVKQDKSGDGLPITRIETISAATVDGARVGFAGLTESDCRDWLLENGDILFSHINSVEHVGKCAVYHGVPEKLVHGMNLLCFRSDTAKLLPEFAKYLIRGTEFRSRLSNFINKAVNQASVSIGNLKTIPVCVPPLAEQRRIAAVLDKAEALRAQRRAALAQLDSLTQSLFLDLFGDPVTNSKGWPISPLSELGQIHTGKTPPTKREGMFGGDTPFATPGDLDDGLRCTERTLTEEGAQYTRVVREGSALVGCIGNIGKMAKTPVRTSFNQQINAVEWCSRIDDDYGIAALPFQKHQMLSFASSTVVPILNKSGFSKVTIPVPPLALQREFAQRVAAVEKLKTAQRAALAELDALFAALQHRAFRGEL